MTQQAHDIIFYQGSEHFVSPDPLETYRNAPYFMACSTANHRGYTAVWAVVADYLFLVSLSGWADGAAEPGIRSVFPTCEGPVRADWLTRELMLQSGKLLSPCELDPLYEHETMLYLVSGRIQSARRLQRPRRPMQEDPILRCPLAKVDSIDPRVLRALDACQISTVGDLVFLSGLDIMRRARLELTDIDALERALAERGLTFGMRMPG